MRLKRYIVTNMHIVQLRLFWGCEKRFITHNLHLRANYDLRGYSATIPRPLEEPVLQVNQLALQQLDEHLILLL